LFSEAFMIAILKIIAALTSLLFGLVALWNPKRTAESAFLKAETANGEAEIRASWGGTFLGLGLAALFLRDPEAYMLFGIAYAVTAAVRLISWALNRQLINRTVLFILVFEIISAVIFMLPEGLF
jgi:hypothetical protein